MNDNHQANPERPELLWLILILTLLLILLVMWILLGRNLDDAENSYSFPFTTPEAVGMIIPEDTSFDQQISIQTSTIISEPATISIPVVEVMPNQPLVVADRSTFGSAQLMPLYADASAGATVLAAYPPGTYLTSLEPSGDYESYPVERDGIAWVRIRSRDGLVGWADSTMLQYPGSLISPSGANISVEQAQGPTQSEPSSASQPGNNSQNEAAPTSTPAG